MDIKPITLQGVFDAAWQAFIIEEKPPAVAPSGACCYLTEDGRKCAVGLCIPDGHPAQSRTGSAYAMMDAFADLRGDLAHEQVLQINAAQQELHDGLASADRPTTGQWYNEFKTREAREIIYRNFAQRNRLTVPGEAS